MQTIREEMDMYQQKRLPDQKRMHRLMETVIAPKIYGEQEFAANRVEFMKERKIKKLPLGAVISAARRAGKTRGVSQIVAPVARHVAMRIAIVSPTENQSKDLREMILQNLLELPDGERRIVAKNSRKLYVALYDYEARGLTKRDVLNRKGDYSVILLLTSNASGKVKHLLLHVTILLVEGGRPTCAQLEHRMMAAAGSASSEAGRAAG